MAGMLAGNTTTTQHILVYIHIYTLQKPLETIEREREEPVKLQVCHYGELH